MARTHTVLISVAIAILLVAATALVAANFTNLRTLVSVLARGEWPWITAGVLTHVAYFMLYAHLYRLGFELVGVASRTRSLIPVLFASLFVNVIIPTGAGAAALFIDDAARRDQSAARATVGVVLVEVLDVVTLLPFVAWAMWFLARAQLISGWQLVALTMYVLYLILLLLVLAASARRERLVQRVLVTIQRVANRARRGLRIERALPDSWASTTASRFAAAAQAIIAQPRRLVAALAWATALHVINAAGLWMFARGFGAHVPIDGLVAAFSLGIVFFVIVVVPQAAPVAEAMIMATLIRVGVANGAAVAATLAFRGVNFWLPLVLGALFAWRLGRFGTRPPQETA